VLAVLSGVAAVAYLFWLLFVAKPDNMVLFLLLLTAEAFSITQAAGFWYTIWDQKWSEPDVPDFAQTAETVDVFITVYGEPVEIVAKTLEGAMRIRHPRLSVWLLDDGPSTDIQALAALHGAGYLTRPDRRGAKAGNMNEALKRTSGEYVLILDADHVPEPEFLEKTLGAFSEDEVAFVQTPQYYQNRVTNRVSAGAHEQQGLFYGPILRGKNARGAVFSCGTNVVFRRSALAAVGNMPEDSITEDLRVSLILSEAGYTGVYVPTVLAYGMGPLDVGGYFSQQARWARGGLEILFKRRPYFNGITHGQAIQYSLGFLYWFTGFAYATYLVLPVAYLVFGLRPVQVPNQYPVFFVPYFVLTLVTLGYASDFRMTYRAVWFTLASFPAFIAAFVSSIFGGTARFVVTSKERSARSLRPVRVQVITIIVLILSAILGMVREGTGPSVMNNVAFALGHVLILQGFVRYALKPEGDMWLDDQVSAVPLGDTAKERG
jgi:cellulose synthase (UDP-forming)